MPTDVQQQGGLMDGRNWPAPMINLEHAKRQAKARWHQRRAQGSVNVAKAAFLERHGWRQLPTRSAPTLGNEGRRANMQPTLDW